MNKQKVLIIVFSLIIIASIIISILLITKDNSQDNEIIDGIDIVEKTDLLKDASIDGLTISNIVIMNDENNSTYKAKVTNNNNETFHIDKLYVTFTIDNQDFTVVGLSNMDINSNEDKYISINIDQDLSNASKIDYQLNPES